MKWKREGVEYRAVTRYEDGRKEWRTVGWSIYKDAGGWTVGLLISENGRLTGKHITISWADRLNYAKLLAESAAGQLIHMDNP